jgi:hypothetical protein
VAGEEHAVDIDKACCTHRVHKVRLSVPAPERRYTLSSDSASLFQCNAMQCVSVYRMRRSRRFAAVLDLLVQCS